MMQQLRECDGCRWCCWAYNIGDVPVAKRSLKVLELKPERTHCRHECDQGCAVHNTFFQPITCHDFLCPYLMCAENIHRPDTFQELLERLNGNMSNYIPMVSAEMDIDEAKHLIEGTRTIPAGILLEGCWVKVVLPLDRQPDGSWATTEPMHKIWNL